MEPDNSLQTPHSNLHKRYYAYGLWILLAILLLHLFCTSRYRNLPYQLFTPPTATFTPMFTCTPSNTGTPTLTSTPTLTVTPTATFPSITYSNFQPDHFKMLNVLPNPNVKNFSISDLALVDENVWIATPNGLWRYNHKNKSWACFWPVDPKTRKDDDRDINYEVKTFDDESDERQHFENNQPLGFQKLAYFPPILWAASNIGLFRINLETYAYDLIRYQNDSPLLGRINRIAASKNAVWIAYDNQVDITYHSELSPYNSNSRKGDLNSAAKCFPIYLTRISTNDGSARQVELPVLSTNGSQIKSNTLEVNTTASDMILYENNLWLLNDHNIRRYDPQTKESKTWSRPGRTVLKKKPVLKNQPVPDGTRFYPPRSEPRSFYVEGNHLYIVSSNILLYDPISDDFAEVYNIGDEILENSSLDLSTLEANTKIRKTLFFVSKKSQDNDEDLLWVGSSYDMLSGSRYVISYIKDPTSEWNIYTNQEYNDPKNRIYRNSTEDWVLLNGNLIENNHTTHKSCFFMFTQHKYHDSDFVSLIPQLREFTFK